MDDIKNNYPEDDAEVPAPLELSRETTADYAVDVFWTAEELAAFITLDNARNREGVTLRVMNKKLSEINKVSGCRYTRPKKMKQSRKSKKKRKTADAAPQPSSKKIKVEEEGEILP